MRLLFPALALLCSILPALAAGAAAWTPYGNARFGYWIDIPPGFACGPEADDSDGKSCQSAGGAKLSIWGGYTGVVSDDGFTGEVKFDRDTDADHGLAVTYQKTTPHWAVYSGTRESHIVYVRMIDGCKGDRYAAFQLDYLPADSHAIEPLIARLATSLKQRTCDETAGAN